MGYCRTVLRECLGSQLKQIKSFGPGFGLKSKTFWAVDGLERCDIIYKLRQRLCALRTDTHSGKPSKRIDSVVICTGLGLGLGTEMTLSMTLILAMVSKSLALALASKMLLSSTN